MIGQRKREVSKKSGEIKQSNNLQEAALVIFLRVQVRIPHVE